LRTVLVWAITLFIYYVINEEYGEAFTVPESLVVLLGFVVMISGICVYYSKKAEEEDQISNDTDRRIQNPVEEIADTIEVRRKGSSSG